MNVGLPVANILKKRTVKYMEKENQVSSDAVDIQPESSAEEIYKAYKREKSRSSELELQLREMSIRTAYFKSEIKRLKDA